MWQAGLGVVDFTNPAAVKWYQDKLECLIDMGVDSFKTDFGERIPVKILYIMTDLTRSKCTITIHTFIIRPCSLY